MTRNGKIAVGVLILAILASYFLMPSGAPKKPKQMKVKSQAEIVLGSANNSGGGGGGGQKNNQQKKKQQQKAQQQKELQAARAEESKLAAMDFEILREKFGRDDPFAPIYNIEELTGDMFDLPDLEPLPPMIIEGPRSMDLTAIAVKDGNGIAVINGEMRRVGDSVMGFTVHSITQDRVELINDLKDKAILRLKPKPVSGFEISGSSMSNVNDRSKKGSMSLVPRLDDRIVMPPPGPEMFRGAAPRESKLESRVEADVLDPSEHVLDQVEDLIFQQQQQILDPTRNMVLEKSTSGR